MAVNKLRAKECRNTALKCKQNINFNEKKNSYQHYFFALNHFCYGPNYPKLDEAFRLKQLEPPTGKVRMVLDTDTYNEVDDQFALAYAFLSKEKIELVK